MDPPESDTIRLQDIPLAGSALSHGSFPTNMEAGTVNTRITASLSLDRPTLSWVRSKTVRSFRRWENQRTRTASPERRLRRKGIEEVMKTRKLGNTGLVIPAIGFGCMGLSSVYGAADEATSIAVIHRATSWA